LLLEADLGDVPLESGLDGAPLESDLDGAPLESDLDGAPLVVDGELESLLSEALLDRFDGPEYRSDSQPPPLRMKPPPPIMRRALSFPHFGHFLTGFSVIRCSRSNSWPQPSQL
jgi:hypothetical protein